MASCTELSNGLTDSTSNILKINPVTPPHRTAQSITSRHIKRCDSGYSSDVSAASTSKPRTHRKPIQEDINPTPLRREKQRIIKTVTSPSPSRSRTLSTSSQSSTPPQTHRNHSRHSSAAPTTRRHSTTPSSRRSSFLIRAPSEAYPTSLGSRNRASSVNNFLLYDNPFLQRPVQNSPSRPSSPTPSKTPSSPGLVNQSTHLHPPNSPSFTPPGKESLQPRYTNFVPAASIDWTLPSTQQQKHKRTAKASRGIRGLWRKLFCKREGYIEGDRGCVRRHIQSSLGQGKDGDESVNLPDEKELEKLCGWTCFAVEKGES